MDKLRLALINASLLHDVGKVIYRADKSVGNHSKAGRDFLERVLHDDYPNKKIILESVYNHHADILKKSNLADNHIAYIVYEADNIAAGLDRRVDEGNDAQAVFDAYAPLESVFNLLPTREQKPQKYLLRALGKVDKINYPNMQSPNQTVIPANYKAIVEDMKSNLQRAGEAGLSANELLKITEQLMSFVPSSTNQKEVCDISLYDHQRMTAAVAICMYQYFQANNITDYKQYCFADKNQSFRQKQAFALVSGDISGIQDFIYTITSKGALKNLRGRSFYLEMITEHIIDEIIEELELSRANLIYSGGGHFYLLCANTEKLNEIINLAKEKINAWLLEKYGNSLYIALAAQECTANDFMTQANEKTNKLGNLFRKLSAKLAQAKTNRYTEQQLTDMFDPNSSLNKIKNAEKECANCKTSTSKLQKYSANTEIEVCSACNIIYELGHHILSGNKVMIVSKEQGKCGLLDTPIELPILKTPKYLYLISEKEIEAVSKKLEIDRIYIVNNLLVGGKMSSHIWVGDYAARNKDNSTKEFENLATASCGIKRLGVMRADVDSLGATFTSGFVQPDGSNVYCTLSRYATLSRQLSMFFKKYIVNICNKQITGEDGVEMPYSNILQTLSMEQSNTRELNIVYSGGDDVFVVGAWDEVLNFAMDLQNAFTKFTQGKLTFSAGIGLFDSKFPVAQMARETAKLEDMAKENVFQDKAKNSIALFGVGSVNSEKGNYVQHVYTWQKFRDNVCGEKLEFLLSISKTHEDMLSTGFLYRLVNLLTNNDKINIARLAYSLARLEPGIGASNERKQAYADIRKNIYSWATNKQDKQELLTAIILLVYSERNSNNDK